MTVEKFVKGYKKLTGDTAKKSYFKDLHIKSYIPFTEKLAKAKNIAKVTTHQYDKDGNNTGKIQVNSSFRYVLFTLNLIDMYTDIDVNFQQPATEYDLLAESGLFKEILSQLPEDEVSDFKTLLDMSVDDIMTNELSMQSFIASQVKRFGTLANITISPVLEKVGNELTNLDDEHLQKLDNIIGKFINIAKVVK
jgi:hypothetical protein